MGDSITSGTVAVPASLSTGSTAFQLGRYDARRVRDTTSAVQCRGAYRYSAQNSCGPRRGAVPAQTSEDQWLYAFLLSYLAVSHWPALPGSSFVLDDV